MKKPNAAQVDSLSKNSGRRPKAMGPVRSIVTTKRWYLYLIECADGSVYTGITVDVAARYEAHAAGKGARYTRARPPARLLAVIEYPDRSAASKAEHAVKQLNAAGKRAYASAVGVQQTAAGAAIFGTPS